MRNKFLWVAVLTIATMVSALAPTAKADIINVNSAYGPLPAIYGPAVVTSLQKFDPSQGTLTKVTLTLDSSSSGGSIAWDNESSAPTDVELAIGAQVTASALSTLTAVATPLQTGTITGIGPDSDGVADFIGSDSFMVIAAVASNSDSHSTNTPGELALFTGLDTFDVTLASITKASSMISGGYGPTETEPGITEGWVTVTYEYTTTPEPATVGMLGLGGIFLFKRKRRRA